MFDINYDKNGLELKTMFREKYCKQSNYKLLINKDDYAEFEQVKDMIFLLRDVKYLEIYTKLEIKQIFFVPW